MKSSRYLLTGVLILGISVAAVLILKKNQPVSHVKTNKADQKTMGSPEAPVQMVEYSDFQCPACGYAELILHRFFNQPEYKDKIYFVYRHFPLPGHSRASLAHQAAECANEQGRFWDFHKLLYEEQKKWSESSESTALMLEYAKQLNLSMDAFAICLANPEIYNRIQQEKKKGEDLQIRSTPTFFINGERVVGPMELNNRGENLIRKILNLEPLASPLPMPPVPGMPSDLPATRPIPTPHLTSQGLPEVYPPAPEAPRPSASPAAS